MSIEEIVEQLRQERDRIDSAIRALSSLDATTATTAKAGQHHRAKSKMSAAARRKISLAQKARWAKMKRG
jgi:hypothetical protein